MAEQSVSPLRILDTRKPTWRRPDDEIVDDVIIPALKNTDRFDCMVGYFGGAALKELSHGLAAYILRSKHPLRLLVSPSLSEADQHAIRLGARTPAEVLSDAIGVAFNDETAVASALAQHTQQCLAYLLAKRRLLMKTVLVQNATFHLKEWIFRSHDDIAVLSGSANFTGQALVGNVECLFLQRSWRGGDSEIACHDSIREFEAYWNNSKPHAIAVDLPSAIQAGLINSHDTTRPPTEADYQKALDIEAKLSKGAPPQAHPTVPSITQFTPPATLVWETGPYSYQKTAITRWEKNERRGILAMATGSGKTITALLCAWRLWNTLEQLLVIVSAPTLPLLAQWQHQCSLFNITPYTPREVTPKKKRLQQLDQRLQHLHLTGQGLEFVIVTNDFLNDADFRKLLSLYSGPIMLIADEVHNLGTNAFLDSPLELATYRLGLSATPERQYDPDGSAALTEYFGEIVYDFTLADAIGLCLVPYDYCLHPVLLNHNELDQYRELSDRIRRLQLIRNNEDSDNTDKQLQVLRNRRRLILEMAEGKLEILESLLIQHPLPALKHTLVYATDKDPKQLNAINDIIGSLGIRYHQITAQETKTASLVQEVITAFRTGTIKVLTAKRVLDEGLDVPEISTAIILASTTVERQWVQRRGRVLRKCAATNKEYATIHDFIVLPPPGEPRDNETKQLIKGELARCEEFAELARNRRSSNGPLDILLDIRLEYLV